jgi:hypothetical protein
LQLFASADRIMNIGTGAFVWCIDGWTTVFNAAKAGHKNVVHSPAFYTARHGYQLIASVCPYGDGKG